MVPANDLPRAVGVGDPARGGEYVEPHNGKHYDFYDRVGGEDGERQAAADGADAVFNCAHDTIDVAYVFVFLMRCPKLPLILHVRGKKARRL